MEGFLDAVYFTKPILALIPIFLLLLQIVSGILRSPAWMTAVSAAAHAAGIALLTLTGGTLTDALVLVLLTGFAGMLFCPKPAMPEKPDQRANTPHGEDKA